MFCAKCGDITAPTTAPAPTSSYCSFCFDEGSLRAGYSLGTAMLSLIIAAQIFKALY